MLNKQWNICGE